MLAYVCRNKFSNQQHTMHAGHMSPDPLLGQGIYHLQRGAHIASNKSPAPGKDLAT